MANKNYKGITLEIGGDTTKLSKALDGITKQSKTIQSELKNVNSALKLDPGNVTLVTNKQRLLTEQVEKTKEKLKLLKDAQEEFVKNGGDINSDTYVALEADIVKTEAALKNLNKEQSGLSANMEAFSNKLGSYSDKFGDLASKTKKYSVAAAGALTGMAAAAISFDEAWTGVKKVYQGSDSDLEAIKDSIFELSNATGTAAVDIAAVAEAGATLGITGDDLTKFTEVMVKLGDTTSVSSQEAADSLGKLMNITKTSADEYENLGSAIVNLGNKTAASEDTIISISQRFASAGTQAGMTEADILGLSAAMNAVGVEGEAAGSSLSRTTNKINSAVASSSDKLEVFAATAGMTAEEFKRAWEDDAGSAFESVVVGLNQAAAEGEDLNAILNEMGITSTNDVNAMMSLATSSDVLSDSLRIANEGWDENTALAEESGTYYDSVGSKMNQLKQSVINLAAQLGEHLLPIMMEVVEWLKGIVQWFSNLDPTMQKIIVGAIAVVAALSPFFKVLQGITNGIRLVIKIVGFLKTAITTLFSLIMAHPVIAAITAIIAIVVLLYTKCEWFRDAVNGILKAIGDFFINAKDTIVNAWNRVVEFFTVDIPNAFNSVVEFFSDIVDGIVDFVNSVVDFVKDNWQGLLLFLVNPIAGAFKLIYDNCGEFRKFIDNLVKTIVKFIKDRVNDVVKFFTKTIPETINKIIEWFQKLPYYIGYVIGTIIGFILNLGIKLYEFVTVTVPEFILGIINWFGQLPGKIGAFVSEVLVNITTWVVDMAKQAYEVGSQFLSEIGAWFSQLPGKVWSFISDTFNKVSTWAGEMTNKAIKVGSDFINGIVTWFQQLPGKIWGFLSTVVGNVITWGANMASEAWNAAVNVFNTIVDEIGKLPGKMLEIGVAIVEGIWEGIQSMIGWIGDQIGGFCSGIWDGITGFFGINSPSRLMRDTVGNYLAQGIGVGFIDEMDSVNKDIVKSLETTTGSIQDALSMETSKQLAFETMATQDFSTTLGTFQNSILGAVQEMLNSISIENNFIVDGEAVATGVTPLVDSNLNSIAERSNRQ